MGLEYSTRPELNQWEAKNHAANIKMWLHDLVDGVIVPSIVSLENIFKAIDSYFGITGLGGIDFKATMAYNWTSTHDHDFNELQNAVEDLLVHDHDEDYAPIDHNHSSEYGSLSNVSALLAGTKGFLLVPIVYVGDGNLPRTISFGVNFGSIKMLLLYRINGSIYVYRGSTTTIFWRQVPTFVVFNGIESALSSGSSMSVSHAELNTSADVYYGFVGGVLA